jgi:hypothetical protein
VFNLQMYVTFMVMMSAYWGLTWSKDHYRNVYIKLNWVGFAVWGSYDLYSKHYSGVMLSLFVAWTFGFWAIWSSKSILDKLIKCSLFLFAVYGVAVIFTNHMFD